MATATTTGAAGSTSEETAKTTETAPGTTEVPATEVPKTETSTESKEGAQKESSTEKAFSQAEVDRIVADRLQREKDAAKRKADEEQGKFKELYEQEKAERAREKQEREDADRNAKISTAIDALAGDKKHGAREPKAVAALFDRSKVTVEGDAVKGAEAELERIRKEFPGMFYGPGKVDGGKSVETGVSSENLSPRERMRAAYATK